MGVYYRWIRYVTWSGLASTCAFVAIQGAACSSSSEIDGMTRPEPPVTGPSNGGATDASVIFADLSPSPTGLGDAGTAESINRQNGVTCKESPFKTDVVPVDMMVALDRSGSTAEDNVGRMVVRALEDITQRTATHVHWGLTLYPSLETCTAGVSDCTLPKGPNVQIGVENAAEKIKNVLGQIKRCGSTPTADTLRLILDYMKTVTSPYKKSVLLATDGAPNCNGRLDPATCMTSRTDGAPAGSKNLCLDDKETIAVAKELNEAGYPVYVMGMGHAVQFEAVMNAIAAAGGTEKFYPVTEASQLVSTLEVITGTAITCEFAVHWDTLADNVSRDPTLVNVYRDGTADPIGFSEDCATRTGWTWTNASKDTIRLCPEACQKAKRMEWTGVRTTFGCKSVSVR